jgi:hypothetical protein
MFRAETASLTFSTRHGSCRKIRLYQLFQINVDSSWYSEERHHLRSCKGRCSRPFETQNCNTSVTSTVVEAGAALLSSKIKGTMSHDARTTISPLAAFSISRFLAATLAIGSPKQDGRWCELSFTGRRRIRAFLCGFCHQKEELLALNGVTIQ